MHEALFGREDADPARTSIFEQARGGTLLLDEIGELPLACQASLVRAVERADPGRASPAARLDAWSDVRVLATTRRDLEREIQEGRFRDDLYYRLAAGRVELPPLRNRQGDVAMLVHHFWNAMGGKGTAPGELVRRAAEYAWPGNVRELANVVSQEVALGSLASAERGKRSLGSLSGPPLPEDVIGQTITDDLSFSQARRVVIEAFEKRYVEAVLAKHSGNVSRAAASSGIARRYFYKVRARTER
jgi:DNA-binding NtrC family response regulator